MINKISLPNITSIFFATDETGMYNNILERFDGTAQKTIRSLHTTRGGIGGRRRTIRNPRYDFTNSLIICVGKSTYARCGVVVNVTPIEPEFEGQVVLEFSNTTTLPVKIYANEGACQFLFFKADNICKTSYADRKGKYQGQKGITLAKI